MRDHDALYDESIDEPPFSNSTDGDGWIAANCRTCIHDKEQRADKVTGPGCPLLLIAVTGRTPAQWFMGPRDENGRHRIADKYRCIEYRHEDDGPGPEPQPIPTPPGQGELLPREPFEGHRMLTTIPEGVTTHA